MALPFVDPSVKMTDHQCLLAYGISEDQIRKLTKSQMNQIVAKARNHIKREAYEKAKDRELMTRQATQRGS